MIYNIYNTIYFFLNCVKEINNNSTCKNNSHNNSKYLYSKNHLIHKFVCIFLTKEEENRETRKTRNRYKERKEKKKKRNANYSIQRALFVQMTSIFTKC